MKRNDSPSVLCLKSFQKHRNIILTTVSIDSFISVKVAPRLELSVECVVKNRSRYPENPLANKPDLPRNTCFFCEDLIIRIESMDFSVCGSFESHARSFSSEYLLNLVKLSFIFH